jgi:hypothetical protein
MLQQTAINSRRHNSRVETPDGVWVYWNCGAHSDTSRVRNLSFGGLFVETPVRVLVGARSKLDFLVQEGQISMEALVRHVVPGLGAGLKFAAVKEGSLPRLVSLLDRLRHSS